MVNRITNRKSISIEINKTEAPTKSVDHSISAEKETSPLKLKVI